MKKLLLTVLLTGAFSFFGVCQELELEKTFPLTKDSKEGALLNVNYDNTNQTYTLVYVTKVNKRVAKFETYVFDKDFNSLSQDNKELEFEKAKELYKWFNYKGEEYSDIGVFVDNKDNLILRKKEISYTYNWFKNEYRRKTNTLDKVKLRNDDGDKYYLHKYIEDDLTGEAIILCGSRDKKDKNNHFKDFHILRINKELDVVKDIPIKFEYPQNVLYNRAKWLGDVFNGWFFIFAPQDAGKNSDPVKNNFTFLAVDSKFQITDKINFEAPSTEWDVYDNIIDWDKNEIYIYGATTGSKSDYYNPSTDLEKIKYFQLMKVANHKVQYITLTSLDEFNDKFKTSPNQPKGKPYKGKRFEIVNDKVNDKGEVFIAGQNWDKGGAMGGMAAMSGEKRKTRYTDCFALYFDKDGHLAGQYSYDVKFGMNDFPCEQIFFKGKTGENIYWFVDPNVYLDWPWDCMIYYLPYMAKIDIKKASIGEFINFTPQAAKTSFLKPSFYLDPNFPYLEIEKGKIVLFGKDKAKSCGKNIWFGRVRLD